MKILMLSRLYDPHVGGIEKHLFELNKFLVGKGHKITIITEQYDAFLPLEEKINRVKVLRIPHQLLSSKKALWNWIGNQKHLFEASDIVHIHDVYWWYLPLRLQDIAKEKNFITFHGYDPYGLPKKRHIVSRKIIEYLAKDSIIVGGFMKKWYRSGASNITYGATSVKPGKRRLKSNAIYFGRLEKDVGIMEYLGALKQIKQEIFTDIYGEGNQLNQVQKFINKNRLAVSLHPADYQVTNLLNRYRYVFVSRYLSILEAMQARRLVLAVYDNEIKKDYLYCHPQAHNMIIAGSGMELAEKFNNLNSETEIKMIDEAYRWAKDQTWEKLTELYLNLWQKTR